MNCGSISRNIYTKILIFNFRKRSLLIQLNEYHYVIVKPVFISTKLKKKKKLKLIDVYRKRIKYVPSIISFSMIQQCNNT